MQVVELVTAVLGTLAALFALLQVEAARKTLGRVIAALAGQRVRIIAATVSLGLAVACVAAYGQLRQRQDAQEDSRHASAVLRTLLPPDFRERCVERSESDETDVVAALSCEISDPRAKATYVLYSNERALTARVQERISRLALPDGACGQSAAAHSVFRGSNNEVTGDMLCYATDGVEHLEWTSRALRVYATAEHPVSGTAGRTRAVLFDLWRKAGPSLTYARVGFPDADEEWLLRRVPVEFRRTCKRSATWKPTAARAAVICNGGPPTSSVWYASFPRVASAKAYWAMRSKGAERIESNPSRCAARTRGSYTLKGEDVEARWYCHVDRSGFLWIEWTDPRSSIYSFASAPRAAFKKFERWWLDESGPISADEDSR